MSHIAHIFNCTFSEKIRAKSLLSSTSLAFRKLEINHTALDGDFVQNTSFKTISGRAVANRNMHKWSALRKYKALHFIYLMFPACRFLFTVLEYLLNSVSIA